MNDRRWTRWVMQTARTGGDIWPLVKITGVAMVDADHRRLSDLILLLNGMVEEIRAHNFSLDRIRAHGRLLREVYAYAEAHFHREEVMMEKHQLPGLQGHRQQHLALLEMLRGVLKAFEAGRITVLSELKHAAIDWLIIHTNTSDYASFRMDSWSGAVARAQRWEDIKDAIRQTGVSVIDDDNVTLTTLILDLLRDVSERERAGTADPHFFSAKLAAISQFAGEHFNREEKFLRDYDLPDHANHISRHRDFLRVLSDYADRAARGKLPAQEERREQLLTQWVHHISDHDVNSLSIGIWANKLFEKCSTWDDVKVFIRKTGIESIDSDHRMQVETGLELAALLRPGVYGRKETHEESIRVVTKMCDLAFEHFDREEVIMSERQLPLEARHRAEHDELRAMLDSFRADIASGRLRASQDIKARILSWWLNHTNGMDYDTFVVNCGETEQGKRP